MDRRRFLRAAPIGATAAVIGFAAQAGADTQADTQAGPDGEPWYAITWEVFRILPVAHQEALSSWIVGVAGVRTLDWSEAQFWPGFAVLHVIYRDDHPLIRGVHPYAYDACTGEPNDFAGACQVSTRVEPPGFVLVAMGERDDPHAGRRGHLRGV